MYVGQTTIEIVAQSLIALPYLALGVINATTRRKENIERMTFLKVPCAGLTLSVGVPLQFLGGFMVLLDYRADIGAVILIVFTIVATSIFHRPWLSEDSRGRHMHLSFIFTNLGLIGALLLLV
jgi:putative oxidoreductase